MRKLIIVSFIPALFLSGCFSKSKKIQKDLDLICDSYKKISTDISALPTAIQKNPNQLQESIATLTVGSWGPLLNTVKTQEIKNLLNDIQLADPATRYELVQESARLNGAKFDCPEFNEPYLKMKSLESKLEFEGDSEGEAKEVTDPTTERDNMNNLEDDPYEEL
jgi:hypothetical protein